MLGDEEVLLLSGDVEFQALYKEGGASHAVLGCANQGAKVIGLPRQHATRCCRWSEGLQYSLPGYWEQLAAVSLGGWMGGNLV